MTATNPSVGPDQDLILHIEVYTKGVLAERLAFIGTARAVLGRSPESDVRFPSDERMISSKHAEVVRSGAGYLLRDLGSRNGIFVAGSDAAQLSEVPIEVGSQPMDVTLGPGGPVCRIHAGHVISFANYQVTAQLGEGGMATVFMAREVGLSRLVVLKLIAPSLLLSLDQAEAEAMLQEEARIAAQISHPNVVNIHKAGCFEGVHYIAMEYLRGVNLGRIQSQLARRGSRCPFDLAAVLVSQACAGLHAAHEARDPSGRLLGIVHRDFTPSNIVCSPEGNVKLIDFGVARAIGRRYLSNAGAFVGKPAYASPEQISRPQQLDRRSDVFAAGIILYELCAGEPLFQRDNDYATMAAVISAPVPMLRDAPPALTNLLARALSRDPDQRPATAAQFAEELDRFALSVGGQHLQRQNVAQTLTRLGAVLESPPPRSLVGRPTLFPKPRRRSPPPKQKPQWVPMSRADDRTPPLPRPGPIAPPSAAAPPAAPTQVSLNGESLSIAPAQRIFQRPCRPGTLYAHTAYLAPSASGEPRVLHLIGGLTGNDPLDVERQQRLRGFIETWSKLDAARSPLVQLLASGEAWPQGPFALLVTSAAPEHTWAKLLSPDLLSGAERRTFAQQLTACVADAAGAFPGFVHGALAPQSILLHEARPGVSPASLRLGLGPNLDWLLAETPTGDPPPLGPALYAAPELLRGKAPTAASDVFSAAAIIYELLGGDWSGAREALQRGQRIPPLPIGVALQPSAGNSLFQALRPEPELRPLAAEFARRFLEESVTTPLTGVLELHAPAPGQPASAVQGDGRRLFAYTMLIERDLCPGPQPTPLGRIPALLPAPFGLSFFRGQLAVELLDEGGSANCRPRLYMDAATSGTERLILSTPAGAFEIGSRSRNRLQRIDFYTAFTRAGESIDLPVLKLKLYLRAPGRAVLVWTREPRSGDLHIVCVHITE